MNKRDKHAGHLSSGIRYTKRNIARDTLASRDSVSDGLGAVWQRWNVTVFGACLFCAVFTGPSLADDRPFVAQIEQNSFLKSLLETPTISESRGAHISPDGRSVLFFVDERNVDANEDKGGWRLGRIQESSLSDVRLLELSRNVSVQWIDASRVGYFLSAEKGGLAPGLRMFNVENGADHLVLAKDALGEGASILGDFAWRSDGNAVAFRGSIAGSRDVEPSGVVYDTYVSHKSNVVSLYTYDLDSSTLTRLTPSDYSVAFSYDWSPNGEEIVFAYESRPDININSYFMLTDLAIVDVLSKTIRPLVSEEGGDNFPVWSPTGEAVFFTSHRQGIVYPMGWGAVIDIESAEIRDVIASQRSHSFRFWSRDGDWYVASEPETFSRKLVRVDAATGAAIDIKWLGQEPKQLEYRSSFSFADDGTFVFIQSEPTSPPQIFRSALSDDGRTIEPPQRLTRFGAETPYKNYIQAQTVEWCSTDGEFNLAGILVTPKGVDEPLPTILHLHGGPSQIRGEFNASPWPGMVNAAATAGYAVFTPTTRGRAGFGDEFFGAIGTEGSAMVKPWLDAYSGLQHLIHTGIADPERLAVIGHSYGGALAGYGITQHDFAAAVIHEPGDLDRTHHIAWARADGWQAYLSRDLFGIRNRFDDTEQAMVVEESTLWHADQIDTPVLLQCGLRAQHRKCEDFFIALRELDVPAEYFVYDESHVFAAPIAQYNDVVRTLIWINYWLDRHAED